MNKEKAHASSHGTNAERMALRHAVPLHSPVQPQFRVGHPHEGTRPKEEEKKTAKRGKDDNNGGQEREREREKSKEAGSGLRLHRRPERLFLSHVCMHACQSVCGASHGSPPPLLFSLLSSFPFLAFVRDEEGTSVHTRVVRTRILVYFSFLEAPSLSSLSSFSCVFRFLFR